MTNQILSEEFRRMQKLAGILTESQLNEAEIDFTNKEQFVDFLQNKTKELENKTIKLKVYDTWANEDPEKQKYTGDISVNLGKRTGGTGNLKYDATLVDAGGYKYLSPAKGKKISLTIPSTTGGQGGFENEELKLAGIFKVKSLEIPETQAESQLNEGEEPKYFTMDGTKTENLKKDFTLKPTYDPGMTMICPKDLDDKSDRSDGMLGYIFGLNTLKDKELYPLRENHPDYGKTIVLSQSTKEDLNNLIKSLGGTQIDIKAKSSSPAPQAESIEQVVNEALRVYRKK